MKNIKIEKRSIIIGSILMLTGLLLGWIIFGGSNPEPQKASTEESMAEHDHANETTWTCSMHPQIREDGPGQCPICGMDLIPLDDAGGDGADSPYKIEMSEAAIQIGNIQTTIVSNQAPEKTIYLPGKVKADERRVAEITSRFPGRIERLYINFTGQEVYKGQKLASIYSPDLVTAQKELFEAKSFKETNPGFYEAAVNKLKLWDLTEGQINSLLESKEPRYSFDILSPQSGTVLERKVEVGDYLKEGEGLFQISNLGKVWVTFDAYESDLPWIQVGDKIEFTVQSIPGKTFQSKITFIDPVIDRSTRVASVRVEVDNPKGILKPEMFAQGIIKAELPEVENAVTIPKSSILWTGKRAVVYVKDQASDKPIFEFREISLGADAGDYYIVQDGLTAGEEIVANGTFKIDAAAQLQGKVSMMNPEGGSGSMPGMPGMKMGEGADMKNKQISTEKFVEGKAYNFREKTPATFRKQLDAAIEAYLSLKNGLIEADEKATAKYSTALFNALQKVDGSKLNGDAKAFWEEKKDFLMQHAKLCKEAPSIAGKRENFIYLSQPMIKLVEAFGPGNEKLYVDYCPMADDNKGAFWLSASKEIQNPFMAEAMRTCGEVKQEIPSN
ncbi:efflux RND transporter periplasmic adaptor subunit [Cyclobacterium marinum]|uniref:efflux RND transporter periplasmic adaptor subunit n=1 Tax=Cyclobacterium marinum TaxID=104 RepID=UPI001659554B|nr:efflux RND transporter periplasmic adaptor subunit [Cyclobacterium marinum]